MITSAYELISVWKETYIGTALLYQKAENKKFKNKCFKMIKKRFGDLRRGQYIIIILTFSIKSK